MNGKNCIFNIIFITTGLYMIKWRYNFIEYNNVRKEQLKLITQKFDNEYQKK